jgi:hypothetical protein
MPQKASDFIKTIEDDRTDKDGNIVLSVNELMEELGGNTAFSFDQIIQQLAACDDDSDDFIINYRDLRYRVPIDSIREYFEEHAKPEKPMSLREENKYLRDKLAEAVERIKALESGLGEAKAKKKTPNQAKEAYQKKDLKTVDPKVRAPREPSPPPAEDEGEQGLSEIHDQIKRDLEGKKTRIANRDGKESVL